MTAFFLMGGKSNAKFLVVERLIGLFMRECKISMSKKYLGNNYHLNNFYIL